MVLVIEIKNGKGLLGVVHHLDSSGLISMRFKIRQMMHFPLFHCQPVLQSNDFRCLL